MTPASTPLPELIERVKAAKAQRNVLQNVLAVYEVTVSADLSPDVLWLADNGYLGRWPGFDTRSVRLRITPAGRALLTALTEHPLP